MKKIAAIGFALLMVFAVFVPFASANDGAKETKGYLYVDLACRSPQIGGEFSIAPVVVTAPFTDAARVDVGFVNEYVKYMGEVKVIQFLPQGQVDLQVEPGTYILAMQDGNNGQPEFALVTIGAGEKETVVFLGHGISGITEKAKDVITVTEATYGAQRVVVDQAAYTETVTDIAAYDETVVDVPAVAPHYEHVTDTVVDVPAHTEYAPAISHSHYQIIDVKYFIHEGFKVKCTNHAQHGDGYHVQTAACTAEYNYVYGAFTDTQPTYGVYQTRTVEATYKQVQCTHYDEGTPAVTHVVHHEAQTHTVFHPAVTHTEGTFVDVKAEVQALLDGGQQTMVFDNRPNPGGIFDAVGGNLMKIIADPAYGQVKAVHIVYTVNGGEPKTVDKQEYEVFTLA